MTDFLSHVSIEGDESIDFISDLHLQSSELPTFKAWSDYMDQTPAKALFILGDFFELWAGDDIVQSPEGAFEEECIRILKKRSQNCAIYFMAGNRDFLLKKNALNASAMQALADPCVLSAQGQRIVLSHGDAMCLSDTEYQKFRMTVRDSDWQTQFLNQPLESRLAIAKAMRLKSEQGKSRVRESFEKSINQDLNESETNDLKAEPADSHMGLHDVDVQYASSVLDTLHSKLLIHGHTHRPGQYALLNGKSRVVLSDWNASSNPKRLEVLRLESGQLQRIKLSKA